MLAYIIRMIPEAIRVGFKNADLLPVNQNAQKVRQLQHSDVFDN